MIKRFLYSIVIFIPVFFFFSPLKLNRLLHLIDSHLIKHAKKTNLSLFQCLKKLSFIITQYTFTRMRQNKAYSLNVGSEIIPVYCHMEGTTQLEACGGGGWTLVMKIDGEKVAAA